MNVIDHHLYTTIPVTDFRKKCWLTFDLDGMSKADAVTKLAEYTNYPERVYESGKANGYGLNGMCFKFRNAAGKADVKYEAWCVSVPLMRVEEMKLIEIEAAGMQDEARGKQLLIDLLRHVIRISPMVSTMMLTIIIQLLLSRMRYGGNAV